VYSVIAVGGDVGLGNVKKEIADEIVVSAFVPGRGAGFNDKAAASTPLKRIGDAEDIAAAITACITMLGYSTGHIVQVDGGRAL
jgi:3-oxoacyl-[acyl-carrier protein] reductase